MASSAESIKPGVTPSNFGSYLTFEINSDITRIVQKTISMGDRPSACDDPSLASSKAMGCCAYRFKEMKRCGCPTMDPIKNPDLWEFYTNRVKQVVVKQISDSSEEIILTFFASGSLLLDSNLLDEVFTLLIENEWEGKLHLQFIDYIYQIDDAKLYLAEIQGASDAANATIKKIALLMGVGGAISTTYGHIKDSKKARDIGLIFIIMGIALGAFALVQDASSKSEADMSNITKDEEAQQAISSFIDTLQGMIPEKVNAEISFFPNHVACELHGRPCDALLGYDIENSLDDFNYLRERQLKETGYSLAMIKTKKENGVLVPGYTEGSRTEASPVQLLETHADEQ